MSITVWRFLLNVASTLAIFYWMIVWVSGCKAGKEPSEQDVETREERWKRFKVESSRWLSNRYWTWNSFQAQNLEYLGFRPPKAGKPLLGRGKSGLSGCDVSSCNRGHCGLQLSVSTHLTPHNCLSTGLIGQMEVPKAFPNTQPCTCHEP